MEELQKLYDVLVRDGYYTNDFETFISKWDDPEYKQKVYEVASRDGLYTQDFKSFNNKYQKKKIESDFIAQDQDGELVTGDTSLAIQPQTEQDYFEGTFGDILRGFDSVTQAGLGDFVDDMARSVATGYYQGQVAEDASDILLRGANATDEDIYSFIEANKEAQKLGPSDEMMAYQKTYEENGKGFMGVLMGLYKSGFQVIPEVILSSITSMATNKDSLMAAGGIIGSGAAVGATTGAAGGTVALPVIGTIGGAAAGAITGAAATLPYAFAAAGSVLEMGATFSELLQEEIEGELTPEKIREALNDDKIYTSLRNRALARGLTIGVIDAFTGRLGGKVAGGILRKAGKGATKGTKIKSVLAASGIESVGGSVGEATARGVIGQEMDISEIALEGIAEAPGGIKDVISARFSKPKYKVNGKKVDVETIDNLIETMTLDQLQSTKIKIDNDYEGRADKLSDRILQLNTERLILEANPDINPETLAEITNLQLELSSLEGNKTEVAKEKSSIIKAKIKDLQENQLEAEVDTEVDAFRELEQSEQLKYIEQASKELVEESESKGDEEFEITEQQNLQRAVELFNKDQQTETDTEVEVTPEEETEVKEERYNDSQIPVSQQKITYEDDNGETNIATVTTQLDGSRKLQLSDQEGTLFSTETISKDNTLTNEEYVTKAAVDSVIKTTEDVDIKTVINPKLESRISDRQRKAAGLDVTTEADVDVDVDDEVVYEMNKTNKRTWSKDFEILDNRQGQEETLFDKEGNKTSDKWWVVNKVTGQIIEVGTKTMAKDVVANAPAYAETFGDGTKVGADMLVTPAPAPAPAPKAEVKVEEQVEVTPEENERVNQLVELSPNFREDNGEVIMGGISVKVEDLLAMTDDKFNAFIKNVTKRFKLKTLATPQTDPEISRIENEIENDQMNIETSQEEITIEKDNFREEVARIKEEKAKIRKDKKLSKDQKSEAIEEKISEQEDLKQEMDGVIESYKEDIKENQREIRKAKKALEKITQKPIKQVTKVEQQVENAKKALNNLDKDIKIVLHNDDSSYRKATGEEGRSQSSRGEYNPSTKTIHINATKVQDNTVAHEVFHALLLRNGITNKQAKAITDKMLKAVKKTASPELLQKLKEHSESYESALQSEESIAELFGILASEYKSLDKPTQNLVQRWVNKLSKILGVKKFTDAEVIDLLNVVSAKVEAGQEITEQDVAILDKNKSKKEIIKSRKQTFSKASSVEMFENLEILQPKREANGRTKVIELGRAFDKRAKDNGYYIPIPKNGVYTDSQLNKIAEAMTDDAQLQLLQDDSGIGWYDLKTKSAMELMSRIHPELSDSNSKPHLEFTLMVALISQNNSVGINFRQANEAYTYYKNNNKLPNKPYAGKSGNIIKQNIALAFEAIKKKGWKKYKNTLQETKTVKEWEAEGYKVNGENKTTKITGAMAMLGSKIGSFWGNLNGDFNTLTADLWFSRMFNRYTGNVVSKKATEKSKQTTLDELKKYKGKTLLNGYKKSDILKGGKVFDKWLNTIVKDYADGGYKDKQRLNIVSNTHFKNTKGELQDIPRGGKERNTMRNVVKRVQDKLIERGYPKLDIADIQAIVWYNEKDLYRQYKAVNKSSEKTDYETAAQEVLREQGVNAEVALPFKTSKSSADGGRKQTDRIQPKSLSEKVEDAPQSRKQENVSEKVKQEIKLGKLINPTRISVKGIDISDLIFAQSYGKDRTINSNIKSLKSDIEFAKKLSTTDKINTTRLRLRLIKNIDIAVGVFEKEAKLIQSKLIKKDGSLNNRASEKIKDLESRIDLLENAKNIISENLFSPSDLKITDAPQSRKQKAYPLEDIGKWYGDADYKRRGGELVYMTPDEFLSKAKPLKMDEDTQENIDDLVSHIEDGRKLDPLTLYSLDKTDVRSSDGRHRAYAAKELNINSVPVVDFTNSQSRKQQDAPQSRKQADLAPNGKPSNLTPEQYKLVRTPAFKNWFGDWETDPANASKVVDENGEPLVVYHGTPDGRFLDEDGIFKSQDQIFGMGSGIGVHWFAKDITTAKSYAKDKFAFDYQNSVPKVLPAFLNIRNPFIKNGENSLWRNVQQKGKTRNLISKALESKKDGVIVDNVKDNYNNSNKTKSTDTFTVFNSNQIKLADGSNITFDPEAPSVRKQKPSKKPTQKRTSSIKKSITEIKNVLNITPDEQRKIFTALNDQKKKAKDIKKDIIASLRELTKKGKITPSKMVSVINKVPDDFNNPITVERFVEYMTKVFNNADYGNKMTIANAKKGKAKKNASTKIGIAEGLVEQLQRLFSVKPSLIPDSVLDQYMSLIDMFGKREAVLSLTSIEEVTQMTESILEQLDEEQSMAIELADRYEAAEKVYNKKTGDLDYAATIKQMLDNEVVTDREYEVMKKYKSVINPPAPATPKTEAEIEAERQDTIKNIKETKEIDPSVLPSRLERDDAKEFNKLLKTDAIEGLSLDDLKNLFKVIDNINNGYLPHYAKIMISKMTAINDAKVGTNAINRSKLLPLSKIYANLKSKITKKSGTSELVRRNPTFYIDQVFGDFKTQDIFNSIFKRSAEASASYTKDIKEIQAKIEKSEQSVLKSFKRNPNKTQESKYKQMCYLIQQEFLSNPESNQVNSVEDFLEATIKRIKQETTNYTDNDAKMLQEILDTYTNNGTRTFDNVALYESFNVAERNSIKTLEGINKSLTESAVYTANIIRGNKITPLKNYTHLSVIPDVAKGDIVETETSMISDMFNKYLKPSTKAKSLIERTGKASPLNFDVYASVHRGSKYTLMDFHLTDPIRTARRTLNEIEKSLSDKDGNMPSDSRRKFNAIRDASVESIENLLSNALTQSTIGDQVADYIQKQGYRAILAGVPRAAYELTSNVLAGMFMDPKGFLTGIKLRKIIGTPAAKDIMDNLDSTQTNRIFSTGLSGKFVDTGILNQAAGVTASKAKGKVKNTILQLWNNSGQRWIKGVEFTADTLISSPDKLVMQPMWFGSFENRFKQITGTSPDFDKIAANDEAYMDKYSSALKEAKTLADNRSVSIGATDNSFMGILKGTVKPNQGISLRLFNSFNGFMTRFLIFEYITARTGIMAAIGNGQVSKRQGVALLSGVTTRMVAYTFLGSLVAESIKSLNDDDDDEDFDFSQTQYEDGDDEGMKSIDKMLGQAMTSAFTSLLFGRDFGNATKSIINYGLEELNENYGQFLRDGEYDKYRDAIQYTLIPEGRSGKSPQFMDVAKNLFAAYTPMLKTLEFGVNKIFETDKVEPDAIERQKDERFVRLPLEALGVAGFIPFYKDIRKIVLADLYKGLRKAKKESANKKKRKEEMLQGYSSETDMKRYDFPLWERTFGPESPGYDRRQAEKELRRKERKLRQLKKDQMYDYTPPSNNRKRKSSSPFGPLSDGDKSSPFGA